MSTGNMRDSGQLSITLTKPNIAKGHAQSRLLQGCWNISVLGLAPASDSLKKGHVDLLGYWQITVASSDSVLEEWGKDISMVGW